MKKFIYKIVNYCFIVIIIFSSSYYVFQSFNNNLIQNLITDEEVLIMGDSHTKCAIIPEMFPKTINISVEAEPYFFTYLKLKKVIKYSKSTKTVFLGFGHHNLSTYYERKQKQRTTTNNYNLNLFDSTADFIKYCDNNPINIITNAYYSITGVIYQLPKLITQTNESLNDISSWGGFYQSSKSIINDSNTVANAIDWYFLDEKFSVTQLSYLEKIIHLCVNNNINVVLVNTPVHKSYKMRIPIDFNNKFIKICKTLKNVTFINANNINYEDNFYGDGDHLNEKGAYVFTKYIKSNHILD